MTTLTIGDALMLTGSVQTDVTGAAMTVYVKQPDGTTLGPYSVNAMDDETGDWSIDAGDVLTMPGWHEVEVRVVFIGDRPQTFALDEDDSQVGFLVREAFAA